VTALRGVSLSTHSFESDHHVGPAPAAPQTYHCPMGHSTTLTFAVELLDEEIPALWDCPKCGRHAHRDETAARRVGGTAEGRALTSPRTESANKNHFDMLRERRSHDELEQLLAERLDVLRGRA